MAKPKIKHTITKKEWNKKHKDFKTTINGTPYIMMYDDKVGTYLAPVKIVDESMDENFAVHMAVAKAIADQKVKNPETKKDVKVTTALKDKNHPAHKQAKSLFQRIKDRIMGEGVDEAIEEMDLNDPIMVKLRAAQMKRNKDAAKKIDTEKQNKNATKIKALKKKRAQVMRDMEQEAEPEGGKIADRYGKLLNRIDNDIIKLGGNPMTEEVNEAKTITIKFNDDDQTLHFSDGQKSKVDYDGEFKYKGKWFDTSKMKSSKDLEKMLSKAFPGTKFIQKESVNEANAQLNKKVKKYLDDYLRDEKKNSPEHQEAIMLIMRGALIDANFHSEARQLSKYFPKAKGKYIGTPMEDVIEDKGIQIAKWAKWDGYDIIDAFAFYTSMSIGGSFGAKFQSLKESLNEGKKFKQVKKDKYGNHLEPQFKKGDKVTYLGNKGVITGVNKEMGGVYSYNVSYDKGNGRTKASNIFNKSGNDLKIESVNEAYIVTYAKKKGEKPVSAAFQLRGSALSFERDLKKDGYITMITQKKVKGVDESVNEATDVEVYHKSYTHAIEAAKVYAGKRGYTIDDDEMFTKVAMNSKRPSVGKTTRVSLELLKNGKPQRKMLHIQVYGMKNGYELNAYIN